MLGLGIAFLGLAVAPSAVARAQGSLFLRGARAYAEGRYAEAATHFSDAYAADPDPTYLYHLGRALEGAGDPSGALHAYESWMALAPDAPERAEVEGTLERLRAEAFALAPEEEEPDAASEDDEAASDGAESSRVRASLVRPDESRRPSPWPWVVLAGGAVVFLVGIIPGAMALDSHGAADRAPSHALAVARESAAQSQATAATALMVIGGLVAVGGGTWGVIDVLSPSPATSDDDDDDVTPSPASSAAWLRISPGSAALEGTF